MTKRPAAPRPAFARSARPAPHSRSRLTARLRAATATGPRVAVLAALGGLTVGLPVAGLTGTGVTPAHAAISAVAAETNLVDLVDTAGDSTAPGSQATAEALTLDRAGQARVEVEAASRESGTSVVCGPVGGANGVSAAMTTTQGQVPAVVQPMQAGTYAISSGYGGRTHPIHGDARMHEGVDYAAPAGTPIHAVAGGTVIHSGPNIGAPGTLVVIEHQIDGAVWTTWYLHMYAEDIAVTQGQQLAAGDLVGLVGSAGNSTGPHLHLEIHSGPGTGGPTVEPTAWLAERGAAEVGSSCA